nr:retrovirus-related Pol polyprotein from transposon TNT 1-94 [Tanacetum cinerariifolium]
MGYVFVLNGRAIDWKSAEQSTTAMYSTEAEYTVTVEASMKVVWMKEFIDGLGGEKGCLLIKGRSDEVGATIYQNI